MKIDPIDRVGGDPAYQRVHLMFMVEWWSGRVLPTVCNPRKAEEARQALARRS